MVAYEIDFWEVRSCEVGLHVKGDADNLQAATYNQ
jgi:hypothetical protein